MATPTYEYRPASNEWHPISDSTFETQAQSGDISSTITIASYNVKRHRGVLESMAANDGIASIVVLHGVDDDFLGTALCHAAVQDIYQYSSHGPSSNGRKSSDVVVLSRKPFRWRPLPLLTDGNAPACLAVEVLGVPAIVVAATLDHVHLRTQAPSKRLAELLDRTRAQHQNSPLALVVDFGTSFVPKFVTCSGGRNPSTSGSPREKMQDAWVMARCCVGESSTICSPLPLSLEKLDAMSGEEEGCKGPAGGSINSASSGPTRSRRLARIYLYPQHRFSAMGFNIVGHGPPQTGGHGGSGIRCLLKIHDGNDDDADVGTGALRTKDTGRLLNQASPQLRHTGSPPAAHECLRKILEECGCWPTPEQERRLFAAFHLVEETVRNAMPGQVSGRTAKARSVVFIPVGSLGLGVWARDSGVDCLCIGPYSSKTFFSLTIKSLLHAPSGGIRLLRRVMTGAGTFLELDVDGIKATLRYCAAASVVDDWPTAMRRPPSDVLFSSMNRESLAALQSVRDMYSMLRSIPDLGQFRIAHIFIREWAQARGVFSSHHGYLCGTSLSVMLTAVSKHLALQLDALDGASGDTFAACQLVAAFFHDYADFDFASKVVCDPYYYPDMPASRQTRGDGMTIMGWHLPFRNIATMSTKHSANVLSQELERARSALKDVSLNWSSLQGQPHQSASRFISHFQTFIKIDVSYWGSSAQRGRLFSSWVGSRSASLPIEISRSLPHLFTRPWPQRFIKPTDQLVVRGLAADGKQESSDSSRSQSSPVGLGTGGDMIVDTCYLIGVRWPVGSKTLFEERLLDILDRFRRQIRSDHIYFDERVCFIDATVVSQEQLVGLKAVHGSANAGEYRLDIGPDEAYQQEELEGRDQDEHHNQAPAIASQANAGSDGSAAPGLHSKTRLRSALDVLNRIRWDGGMDTRDYVVGFEDRFIGVVEKPLFQWNSDQTDEDFIPQHRIVYFRRTTDNAVVWDRHRRIDDVFGSGNMEKGAARDG